MNTFKLMVHDGHFDRAGLRSNTEIIVDETLKIRHQRSIASCDGGGM